jgi:hypothetical protein
MAIFRIKINMASAIEKEVGRLEIELQEFRNSVYRLKPLVYAAERIIEQREKVTNHIESEILGRLNEAYKRRDPTYAQLSINMVRELIGRLNAGKDVFPEIEKKIIIREIAEWNRLLAYLESLKKSHIRDAGVKEGAHDFRDAANQINDHAFPISQRTDKYLHSAVESWKGTIALLEKEIASIQQVYYRLKKQIEG